jgi:hypothetical protein
MEPAGTFVNRGGAMPTAERESPRVRVKGLRHAFRVSLRKNMPPLSHRAMSTSLMTIHSSPGRLVSTWMGYLTDERSSSCSRSS